MLKICVSGLTASGKTTLSDRIAKELNIKHVQHSYKEHIQKHSSMPDFIDSTSDEFVKDFDRRTVEAASQDCVVSTWLGPWLVEDATLRVWLYAPVGVRAQRYADRHRTSVDDARKLVSSTDNSASRSFKKIYGIDIYDSSIFDIQLNTSTESIDECVSIVSLAVIEKDKR